MKRKVITYNTDKVSSNIEYISCGNDIFVLAYSHEQTDDSTMTVEEVLELSLGEGIKVHFVEGSNIWE